MPAVDRQGQGAAHAHIVERLARLVRRDQGAAVPVALLHGDLVAQSRDQFVARRRREAAELDRRTVGLDRGHADCLLVGEYADEAIEIGQAGAVVVRIAHAGDRLAQQVFLEAERAGTHDVRLEPVRVAVEDVLLVYEGVWIGERRQKCGGGELEVEDDGFRVGCRDAVDHRVIAAAHADDACRRVDDVVPACRHVVGGQRRAVLEFDIAADREGVGAAVVGWRGNRGADVADELGGYGRIFRVGADQHAVERRHRMDRCEGVLAMTVEAWRRVGRDHEGQDAAALWRVVGEGGEAERQEECYASHEPSMHFRFPLPMCVVHRRRYPSKDFNTEEGGRATEGHGESIFIALRA